MVVIIGQGLTYKLKYDNMKTYDWKKTLEKFLIALVEVLVAGTIVYLTDNTIFLVLVPVLESLRNWLKHKN